MKFFKILEYTSNPHEKKYKFLNPQHIVRIVSSGYDGKDLTAVIMTDGQQVLVNIPFVQFELSMTHAGWL